MAAGATGATASSASAVAATADDVLLADLHRLAAAAGAKLQVCRDAAAARRLWPSAALVLVGADLAEELRALGPPRRAGVAILTSGPRDHQLWEPAARLGAEDVIVLPADQHRAVERLADTVDGDPPEAVTVAVVGGCGGAGASTLAAGLAVTAARRDLRVLLVDADPLGGGLDLLLGGEDRSGPRWPDLASAAGRVSASALRAALPEVDGVACLSWDRGAFSSTSPESMRAVLAAGRRGSHLVAVDLPRQLDPAAQEALAQAGTALVVVPGAVRAVAAASRVAGLAGSLAADLRLVVRRPLPAGLDAAAVADALGLPLAGELPADPQLRARLERGEPPGRPGRGPLAATCDNRGTTVEVEVRYAARPPWPLLSALPAIRVGARSVVPVERRW